MNRILQRYGSFVSGHADELGGREAERGPGAPEGRAAVHQHSSQGQGAQKRLSQMGRRGKKNMQRHFKKLKNVI